MCAVLFSPCSKLLGRYILGQHRLLPHPFQFFVLHFPLFILSCYSRLRQEGVSSSRKCQGSTHPCIGWEPIALSPGLKQLGSEGKHFVLEPRLRSEAVTSLAHMSSCRTQRHIYLLCSELVVQRNAGKHTNKISF